MKPHKDELAALAHAIETARRAGSDSEADRLISLFNQLLIEAGAPEELASDVQPTPLNEASVDVPVEKEEVHEIKLEPQVVPPISELRRQAALLETYPEEVRPLIEGVLQEASDLVQVPLVVLEPMFVEEFNALLVRKLSEEPLLSRMDEFQKVRSVILRYKEELFSILQERN